MREIASKNLKPGVNYRMVHARKGEAVVKCVAAQEDGGEFIVIEGVLNGVSDRYEAGDAFTSINNLAKFYREKPTTAKNVRQRVTKAIPIEEFGEDHWSTFVYLETRCVDHKGEVNRMHMRCDRDRHPQFAHNDIVTKFPTHTKKGKVKEHDDWDCLDDCEQAGLAVNTGTRLHRVYKLTPLGHRVAAQLRQHKADGGNYHSFVPIKT